MMKRMVAALATFFAAIIYLVLQVDFYEAARLKPQKIQREKDR